VASHHFVAAADLFGYMPSVPSANYGDVLSNAGVLQNVLSFVGRGHWCFVAAVNSDWCRAYGQLLDDIRSAQPGADQQSSVRETFHSAVFASPSRLRLAQACGLQLDAKDWRLRRSAGLLADIATLAAAQQLGLSLTDAVVRSAAETSLSKLHWLHTEQHCSLPDDISVHAAKSGSIEMLKWLQQRGCALDARSCEQAAKAGHLHVLMFLRSQGCPWNTKTCDAAASRGDQQMLQWLRKQGCPWKLSSVCDRVAGSGNVQLMRWLKRGVVFDAVTMRCAAERGQLSMCQYLRAEQCPWSATACEEAAEHSHTDTLIWLHENGCPWVVDRVCMAAARSGSVDVMSYILKYECLSAERLTNMMRAAGANSKLAAVKWLRHKGADWPAILQYSGRCWSGDTLVWARQQGCTSKTM
jgi:hypothetical protein